MGNFNSNVSGSQTAFNTITAWMGGSGSGQLGMTLVDTITASQDVVYSTTGASGNRTKIYIRVTLSAHDEAPGDSGYGAWDNVTFRVYRSWNASNHSGQGEAGRVGPELMAIPNSSSLFGTWYPTNQTSRLAADTWTGGHITPAGNAVFDGRRFWYAYNTQLYTWDPVTAVETDVSVLPANMTTSPLIIYTVDALNGRDYLWFLSYTTIPGETWWKYDIAQNVFTAMFDVPWFATASNATSMICWNGGDRIYMLQGLQATAFAYYSIQNNTWTSLTARSNSPAWVSATANNSLNGFNKMLYVPAALSGNSSDQIFVIPPVGSNTTWLVYNVTGNSWSNVSANLPQATYVTVGGWGFCLTPTVGSNGSIYYWSYNSTNAIIQLYAYSINAGTWSSIAEFNSTAWWSQAGTPQQMIGLRQQVGKLIVPTATGALNLQGVATSGSSLGLVDNICIIATWIIPGTTVKAQRFAYVGYYNPYRNQNVFTLSSNATAGTNAVLTFTALSTGQVNAGDFLEIFDPTATVTPLHGPNELTPTPIYGDGNPSTSWTPGGGELVQVVSVNVGSRQVTVASLLHGYAATTTSVGQAACPAIVTSDACTAIATSSPNGYQIDGHPDTYKLLCLPNSTFSNIVDAFGISIGFEFVLANYSTSSTSRGIPGELFNVTVAPSTAVAGNIAQQETQQFAIVTPYQQQNTGETRSYQIGILNA